MDGDENVLPPNVNRGPALLGATYSLYALTVLIFIVRMCARRDKLALTAADYTVTVALIAKTVSIAFMTVAIRHGFGRHNYYISDADRATIRRKLLGVYMSGVPASCFARISIACLLLQITRARWWRVAIWTTLVVQVLVVLTYEAAQLSQCGGVISGNNPHDSHCLPRSQVWGFTMMSFTSAFVSDLTCAIIPLHLIRSLPRSPLEKGLISVLMASSLLASSFGIPKLYHVLTYHFGHPDGLWLLLPEFFWCRMEEAAIIMAACAPLLKVPAERALRKLGFEWAAAPPVRELNAVSSGGVTPRADPEDVEKSAGAAPSVGSSSVGRGGGSGADEASSTRGILGVER
ncbi:uncharacterized protein DNG_00511 [Cephalotrichum gorgonifer]|uniref:Rhodopsin domain-containing protein n=1 Tax=Cephalotrichum gorgonifer TaxID=2041049 RepID=A0AAE8MNZ1_9PEZI|nr:uncharacterized protein DNG_00511 [Cephalotrichum gorgonifer]